MWPLLTAFSSAFLAATLLPVASEGVLAGLALKTDAPWLGLWLAASVGNTLGSLVNYAMGRFARRLMGRRWFPVSPAQLKRASRWFARLGQPALLLAWVPVVGDALTVAAGVLKVPAFRFTVLVFLGKAARYALLLWALA